MPDQQITVVETTETIVVTETPTQVVEVIQPVRDIVEVNARGPQGPKGDKGDKGDAGDSNTVVTMTAGSALGGHRIVAQSPTNNNTVIYADASNSAHANLVFGMTLNAASNGGSVDVAVCGEFTEPTWNWTLGLPIFLSVDGILTQTVPTSSVADFSLVVGFPITPTKMFVNIREPIFLI
jgi:hypothetical protein